MILEKFIESNLGQVSYIIADKNEAVIIDPRRDIDGYIEFLTRNNLNLKYIINTHTHADYIGGHLELVEIYPSATNIFQKDVPAKFDFIQVKESDVFNIGDLKLKILETPGHTPFCISILVEENGVNKYIFTGDFLFVGDIGRPDLLGDEKLDELVESSYKSANKLWNLKDDVIVFTSHIEGSLCGKNLSNNYFSTIGIEKQTNSSFKLSQNKKEYINNLLNQNIETPKFFKKMAKINIEGPKLLKELLSIKYIFDIMQYVDNKDIFIIDFRHPNCFKEGFIKNSINVYEYSNVNLIIGSLIDIEKELILVGDENTNFKDIIKKLRRIGFDNIIGIYKLDLMDNLEKFKEKQHQKTIDLDKDIMLSDIPNMKNIDFDVKCKNGYKSMAVKSFINKLNGENK